MRYVMFFVLLNTINIAIGQNDYCISLSGNVGLHKIVGEDISSNFNWGRSISFGVESYNRFGSMSPIFGLQYSNNETSNDFNDFIFNMGYLKGHIGIRYPIIKNAVFVSVEGYGSYLLHKEITSSDTKKSSDIDTYLNQYDVGVMSRIHIRILSGVDHRIFESIFLTVAYEYGFLNLIERYSLHLSSQGKWLRNNTLQFVVQIEMK